MVTKDKVIGLSYTLKSMEGDVLEVVKADHPMYYLHGHGQLLPTVEAAVDGKSIGFKSHLDVTMDDAFGPLIEDLVVDLPRSHFPEDMEIKEGMAFNTEGPDGEEIIVEVIKVEEENVTIDGNHPLAGLDLSYDLEVVSIREASEEELSQGEAFNQESSNKVH